MSWPERRAPGARKETARIEKSHGSDKGGNDIHPRGPIAAIDIVGFEQLAERHPVGTGAEPSTIPLIATAFALAKGAATKNSAQHREREGTNQALAARQPDSSAPKNRSTSVLRAAGAPRWPRVAVDGGLGQRRRPGGSPLLSNAPRSCSRRRSDSFFPACAAGGKWSRMKAAFHGRSVPGRYRRSKVEARRPFTAVCSSRGTSRAAGPCAPRGLRHGSGPPLLHLLSGGRRSFRAAVLRPRCSRERTVPSEHCIVSLISS